MTKLTVENYKLENLLNAIREHVGKGNSGFNVTKTLTKLEKALEEVVKKYFYARRDLLTSFSSIDEKTGNMIVAPDKQEEFTKKMDELSQSTSEFEFDLPIVFNVTDDRIFADKFHNAFLKVFWEENYKVEKVA